MDNYYYYSTRVIDFDAMEKMICAERSSDAIVAEVKKSDKVALHDLSVEDRKFRVNEHAVDDLYCKEDLKFRCNAIDIAISKTTKRCTCDANDNSAICTRVESAPASNFSEFQAGSFHISPSSVYPQSLDDLRNDELYGTVLCRLLQSMQGNESDVPTNFASICLMLDVLFDDGVCQKLRIRTVVLLCQVSFDNVLLYNTIERVSTKIGNQLDKESLIRYMLLTLVRQFIHFGEIENNAYVLEHLRGLLLKTDTIGFRTGILILRHLVNIEDKKFENIQQIMDTEALDAITNRYKQLNDNGFKTEPEIVLANEILQLFDAIVRKCRMQIPAKTVKQISIIAFLSIPNRCPHNEEHMISLHMERCYHLIRLSITFFTHGKLDRSNQFAKNVIAKLQELSYSVMSGDYCTTFSLKLTAECFRWASALEIIQPLKMNRKLQRKVVRTGLRCLQENVSYSHKYDRAIFYNRYHDIQNLDSPIAYIGQFIKKAMKNEVLVNDELLFNEGCFTDAKTAAKSGYALGEAALRFLSAYMITKDANGHYMVLMDNVRSYILKGLEIERLRAISIWLLGRYALSTFSSRYLNMSIRSIVSPYLEDTDINVRYETAVLVLISLTRYSEKVKKDKDVGKFSIIEMSNDQFHSLLNSDTFSIRKEAVGDLEKILDGVMKIAECVRSDYFLSLMVPVIRSIDYDNLKNIRFLQKLIDFRGNWATKSYYIYVIMACLAYLSHSYSDNSLAVQTCCDWAIELLLDKRFDGGPQHAIVMKLVRASFQVKLLPEHWKIFCILFTRVVTSHSSDFEDLLLYADCLCRINPWLFIDSVSYRSLTYYCAEWAIENDDTSVSQKISAFKLMELLFDHCQESCFYRGTHIREEFLVGRTIRVLKNVLTIYADEGAICVPALACVATMLNKSFCEENFFEWRVLIELLEKYKMEFLGIHGSIAYIKLWMYVLVQTCLMRPLPFNITDLVNTVLEKFLLINVLRATELYNYPAYIDANTHRADPNFLEVRYPIPEDYRDLSEFVPVLFAMKHAKNENREVFDEFCSVQVFKIYKPAFDELKMKFEKFANHSPEINEELKL